MCWSWQTKPWLSYDNQPSCWHTSFLGSAKAYGIWQETVYMIEQQQRHVKRYRKFAIHTETLNTPPNTWRNNDVVITSKRRHFDVITPKWRRFDIITTSLIYCIMCLLGHKTQLFSCGLAKLIAQSMSLRGSLFTYSHNIHLYHLRNYKNRPRALYLLWVWPRVPPENIWRTKVLCSVGGWPNPIYSIWIIVYWSECIGILFKISIKTAFTPQRQHVVGSWTCNKK